MSRQRSLEVIGQAEEVTIGELVRLSGVRYSTLKFYTEEGLLPFQQAEENLTRRYRRQESLLRIRIKELPGGEFELYIDLIATSHCYALDKAGQDHLLRFSRRGVEHFRPFQRFLDFHALGGQCFFLGLIGQQDTLIFFLRLLQRGLLFRHELVNDAQI